MGWQTGQLLTITECVVRSNDFEPLESVVWNVRVVEVVVVDGQEEWDLV